MVQVLDENDLIILTLDPSWIRMSNGRDFEQTASLLSYSPNDRWIRGVRISASNGVVRPFNVNEEGLAGARLDDYYLTFRTDFSERGVMMEVANDHNEVKGNLEPFLLDSTPQTPQNFDDAALLIGATYSDYDSDVHITTVGKEEMNQCLISRWWLIWGTVESGDAQAPSFEIFASTTHPEPEDLVQLGAMVTDGNTTRYAYSWFVNEQALTEDKYLNKPSIDYKFSDPGRNVVRVTVSDMKGGTASRNIVIVVQGDEATNQSMIAGTVRSSQGSAGSPGGYRKSSHH